MPVGADATSLLDRVSFPVVVKPTVLSASRGVIRADDRVSFATAFDRVRRLLASAEVRELRDPEADVMQIEEYIHGSEYALEGVLENGRVADARDLRQARSARRPVLRRNDLRHAVARDAEHAAADHRAAVAAAATALGLHHGPIHAECRVNARGVFVLEVAARPIGGLCAKALRFEATDGSRLIRRFFEELLLRHALGESMSRLDARIARVGGDDDSDSRAAAYYRQRRWPRDRRRMCRTSRRSRSRPRPDQQLLALPEGSSYLGFIFARADAPAFAERAVREAHARLRFTIDPLFALIDG